jgi:hypothetical protein
MKSGELVKSNEVDENDECCEKGKSGKYGTITLRKNEVWLLVIGSRLVCFLLLCHLY